MSEHVSQPARMDYKSLLDHSFDIGRQDSEYGPESRLAYLSQHIFDFITYDGAMDELFARKAVEVCEAITNLNTFDYIEDPENYQWFLLMCNMPFFAKRIEWGGSIRGAWWGALPGQQIGLQSCGLWAEGKQITAELRFSNEEWSHFIRAVILFASVPLRARRRDILTESDAAASAGQLERLPAEPTPQTSACTAPADGDGAASGPEKTTPSLTKNSWRSSQ